MSISANELKTKGVSVIENSLGQSNELIITVRGKERFVVMDMKHYNYLRECELEAALHQARADVEAGRYITESVDAHIKRVSDDL
jgi:PHD/YefM family antitoxin component YafN of YafNO toxin-antitoxin module